jgi:cobalamin biosynthesis Mg chelatase CobN
MLVMSIVCSCGSSKSSLKQTTATEQKSATQKNDSSVTDKKVVIVENENSNEEIKEVTTEYDTEKPINPETGKHPVKKETVKTTSKGNTSMKRTEDDTKNISTTVEQSTVNKKESVTVEQNKQKSETNIFKQIKWLVLLLSLLGIVAIVGWLIYKKRL